MANEETQTISRLLYVLLIFRYRGLETYNRILSVVDFERENFDPIRNI